MLSVEVYLRRVSKRLSRGVKSIQVFDHDRLVAVVMDRDRYLSAVYAQKIVAHKRVYRKTYNALSTQTVSVALPNKISTEDVQAFLGKGNNAVFFEKISHGKVSVCISPRTFRLLRRTSSLKMSCNNLRAYINGLPLRRRNGELMISGTPREI